MALPNHFHLVSIDLQSLTGSFIELSVLSPGQIQMHGTTGHMRLASATSCRTTMAACQTTHSHLERCTRSPSSLSQSISQALPAIHSPDRHPARNPQCWLPQRGHNETSELLRFGDFARGTVVHLQSGDSPVIELRNDAGNGGGKGQATTPMAVETWESGEEEREV